MGGTLCKDCPLLPNCLRIDLCQDMRDCDKYVKDWRLLEQFYAARNIVRNYFNPPQQYQCQDQCHCQVENKPDKKRKKSKKH